VGHVEADGEAKGLVTRRGVEELGHGLRHDGGDGVGLGAMVGTRGGFVVVFGEEFRPAVVSPPVVEFLIGFAFKGVVFDAEFSDEAGVVAMAPEHGGVGLLPLLCGQHI